ncbi:MAG: nucleotidyltransferase family protein, partial [Clostridia bacterium]|nr:nucleotidyltransferase family protein [Clostridia bacterium]
IKMYSNTGLSYPLARAKATEDILGEDAAKTLSSPNNILGIEYCKALIKLQSRISPFPILRKGADHDSKTTFENIASATHIRELILNGNQAEADKYMPDFAVEIFKDAKRHSIKALEKSILCELIKMPAEALANIADVSEGLENRIKATLTPSVSLDELIESIKTKRYTHSRISRIILSAFLGITDSQRRTSPMYIKVLDHNETGQKVIAAAKKSATLPIVRNTSQINKLKNPDLKAIWEKEQMFDRIFEMTAM